MLAYYESESQRLKESTSLLELAMWKMKLDAGMDQVEAMGGGNKKMKMDTLDFRLQSRISYGADNVVGKCVAISSTSRFCALSTSATTTMMKTGEHAD